MGVLNWQAVGEQLCSKLRSFEISELLAGAKILGKKAAAFMQ